MAATASLVGVALLLLAGYLLFFDYSERLRSGLEADLARLSGAPAHVGSIDLDLPTFGFEVRQIEVRAPGVPEPVLDIDRVHGRLRPLEILNLRLHWSELLVDGMTLRLVEEEERGVRIPVPEGSSAPFSAAGLSFAASRVSLRDATIVLVNERVPWELEAENLELSLDRALASGYRGRLAYDRGRLEVKGREFHEASVRARFDLEGHELFLKEASLTTSYADLRGTGKLDFAGALRGRFDVTAEADAGLAASIVLGRRPGAERLADGQIQLRGMLYVEPQAKKLEGTLTLPRGRIGGMPVVDWRGELFWDRGLFQIRDASGRLAGGTGRVQLRKPLPSTEHAMTLDLEVDGASLASLVQEYRGVSSPLQSRVTAQASLVLAAGGPKLFDGTFEVSGVSPVRVAADADPHPEAREGVRFEARGHLRQGDLVIEEAEFSTDTLSGAVSGLYPREGPAALAIEVASSDLGQTDLLQRELRRLFRSEDEPAPELLGIEGSGRARGRLTERLPHMAFEGELGAERLLFQSVHFEEVRARGTLSRERLRFEDLVASRGRGGVAGSGSLTFRGPMAERPFDVELTLADWPTEEVSGALGLPLPIRGALTGDVALRRGPLGRLHGGASLELSSGAYGELLFERARGRVELADERLTVEDFTLASPGVEARGRLELDLARRDLTGSLATRRLALSELLPETDVRGRMEVRVELGGTLESPQASLSGRGRGLWLSGVELGEAFLSGEVREQTLDLHASFEREASELVAEATCRLGGSYPVSGRLVWRQLDARPWVFGQDGGSLRIDSDGEASFRAELGGPEVLDTLDLEAALADVTVEGERYRFTSAAPVELVLSEGRLQVGSLELTRGSSRIALGGIVDVRDESLELDATGVLALELLESFYPELETRGALDLKARVGGTWGRPSLTGFADFRGGALRLEGFPQALGGLRGRLVFDNRTVRLSEVRGVFGSGPVTMSGTITLEGLEPGSTDLELHGSGVRLRYPEGLVATLDADLVLVGGSDERVLSGGVELRDAVWSREYDLVSGILSDRDGSGLFEDISEEGFIADLRLDVSIRAPETLSLRNSLAEIDAAAELELRGTVRDPVLLGTTEARRGDVYFLGQRYEIVEGKVDFVDPTKVEPFIDLRAETRVRSYRVELRLTGTPERFQPELTSDPPLRTVDILRLLAGANERDIGLLGNEEEELAGVGVASLLTERLSQEVGRRAERLFGIDRFAIDPFLLGQFANPTARVSIGKQITRDLIINYSTNLNAATEAIILIEYTPEGPMSWILSRSEEGDVGIDVKFRKSF